MMLCWFVGGWCFAAIILVLAPWPCMALQSSRLRLYAAVNCYVQRMSDLYYGLYCNGLGSEENWKFVNLLHTLVIAMYAQ